MRAKSTVDGEEIVAIFFLSWHYHKIKLEKKEPPLSELRGEDLISCDAITNISRQSMVFIIESVHFMHFIKFL
jgi:hypothetical protein